MRTPLDRIRRGAILSFIVLVVSVVVYRVAENDKGWIESLWFVVITLSSLGYGEDSQQSPAMQLFTIGVIIVGLTAAFYTVGGFIQMMTEGEIDRALGRRRTTRGIDRLEGHVVICGFGRVGRFVAESLQRQKQAFVVIDIDSDRSEEARERGYLLINGDATEDEVLAEAGVERAKSVVTTLPSDADNVFITLTSRNLSADLQIIARAGHATSEKKLRQAGANKIVMPTVVSARQMVRMLTRPSTADLMEVVHEIDNLDAELDEITVPRENRLVGVSVRETEAHRKHRLLVVAVKQADDTMVFNPDADYLFKAGDIVIIMGRNEDIARFRDECSV